MQHDPASAFALMHDHSIDKHLLVIEENKARIDQNLTELRALKIDAKFKAQLDKVTKARKEFVEQGLLPAVEPLRASQYHDANVLLLQQMNPRFSKVDEETSRFIAEISAHGRDLLELSKQRYSSQLTIFIGLLVLTTLAALFAVLVLLRVIVRPLGHARDVFDSIGQGNYRNEIQIERNDEVGKVLESLKAMRTRLACDMAEAKRVGDETCASAAPSTTSPPMSPPMSWWRTTSAGSST